MMELKRYQHDLDRPFMRRLLNSRGVSEGFIDDLPTIGYMAFEEGEPAAACFMRIMEGQNRVAMVDGLISNAGMSPQLRNLALDAVVKKTIAMSRAIGMQELIAFTEDESVILRAEKLNFVKLPHIVLRLDLRERAS